MVEPLKVSEENVKKEAVCKKRKVLAPWRFQKGFNRWQNRNKAQKFENGRIFTDFECLNTKLNNGDVNQGSDKQVNHEENSNGRKDSNKPQIMHKLHKAVATWRFKPGYKRYFSEHKLRRRRNFINPYPQRKYPCSVRISADSGFEFSNFSTRDSVISSLREFQSIYRELLVEEEAQRVSGSGSGSGSGFLRRDWAAFRKYKERNSYDDAKKFIGEVPGTQIGDVFHLRLELCLVGLHRQHQLSVDFVRREESNLAISVISYGDLFAPKKKNNKIDIVDFTGSSVVASEVTLNGSNLALVRSSETKTPVRFIYGFNRHLSPSGILKVKTKKLSTYIYCGLYTVEKYWRKRSDDGTHHFYVFRLHRVAGQAELDINKILESKSDSFLFPAVYMEDLSLGIEKVPVSVVNFVNSEKPPFFKYVTGLRTRVLRDPVPPVGCGCTNGCSDSVKCACVVKNGGELPFNHKGHIVEAKPLVFECGPACKCPKTCHNRASQNGMKFRLQVFKTKKMGWGVRALEFIPSGSFVCEYVAELISDEEAQRRTNDEYLFSIGNNYYDEKLWEGLKSSIPALKKGKISRNDPEGGNERSFTLDASEFGNFSRFINHSCTPNLYAQNLLYDHDNKSMPRIMFFACEDIQPMEELAYHYNYSVDQVHDANGNVKKKQCFCGTEECTGWLY